MQQDAPLWTPTGLQPLHHVTVTKPVEGMPEGWTARVLYLHRPDGTVEMFEPLLKYFKDHSSRSSSWQDTAAQAVGLLWDYAVATEPLNPDRRPKDLFRDFARSLATGTIRTDASDPTGLFWKSLDDGRARGLVKAIEAFAEWRQFDTDDETTIAPRFVPVPPNSGGYVTTMLGWYRRREGSMLKHLLHAQKACRTAEVSVVEKRRSPKGCAAEPVKFFPPLYAPKLLWEGYRLQSATHEPNVFLRYNIRNMMIALLDGWGGLRRSEGLHLWCQDVTEDPNNLEHALVVLNHPAEAKVSFTDPITEREIMVSRRECLRQQYGLKPRSEVVRGAYHAGWKGMDLDQNYRACVFWIDPAAGALFWALYWGYRRYVRTPIMAARAALGGRDHPFLFVSGRGDESGDRTALPGEPYSERAYERSHEAAVRRIGLEHAKHLGTTTHGLRHMYGQTLMDLGVPAQVIKKGLHHRNYLSQVPYTVPDNAKTNRNLREAQQNISEGVIRPMSSLDTTPEALLRISEFMSGGPGRGY